MIKKIIAISISAITLTACNSGGDAGGQSSNPSQAMNISVTPNSTGVCSNLNAPCVSLTICDSNNSNCSTINNVLVDTGSYGLRIFSSTINSNTINSLTSITDNNSNPVGECVSYGDGSQNWGGVYKSNIQLSSDSIAPNVPIQIIDANFQNKPAACYNAASDPTTFGYNGVLGVGVYIADGGSYYSCPTSGTCTSYQMPTAQQVSNPIAFLPSNNNGLTISFNGVSNNGSSNVTGILNFGVNTNSQNTISAANIYPATYQSGLPTFNSTYNSNSYYSFLDTGTNTLSLSNSGLTTCASPYTSWLCPSNTTTLNIGNYNSQNNLINSPISIANAFNLLNSNNSAFNNIGTVIPSGIGGQFIDYGLPFFYGKNIQIVFNGSNSNIGTGPFWAW